MTEQNLQHKIEALLFFKNEPVQVKWLADICNTSEDTISGAVTDLAASLEDRGLCIVQAGDTVSLRTASEYSKLIEAITREELEKDIGEAGLETLAVVLYCGPITKSRIDFIRGVNTSYILRHLRARGLVEQKLDPKDKRRYMYSPSQELLSYLGITKPSDAPDYESVVTKLKELEQAYYDQSNKQTQEQHNETSTT